MYLGIFRISYQKVDKQKCMTQTYQNFVFNAFKLRILFGPLTEKSKLVNRCAVVTTESSVSIKKTELHENKRKID